jgi:uncharacterized cupin superfamily protein
MAGQDNRLFLNRDARHLQKLLGDIAGLTKLGFYLIEVPIGSATCTFHQHLCDKECIDILEGTGTAHIGATVLQVEAGDFIAYPAGCEAHDPRNTGSSILKCIIVGQRLDFDIVDYPEQARWLYRANGEKSDLVDMAMIVPRQ